MDKPTIYGFMAAAALGAFIEYAVNPQLLFIASITGATLASRRLHAALAAVLGALYPPLTVFAVIFLTTPQAVGTAAEASQLLAFYLLILGAQAILGFLTGRMLKALLKT